MIQILKKAKIAYTVALQFSFFFIFIDLKLFAFNFFPKQNRPIDFFWHLKIPALQFLPIEHDKIIKIAVLDTFFDQKTTMDRDGQLEHFCLKQCFVVNKNLHKGERFKNCEHFSASSQKKLTTAKLDGACSGVLIKKKHGTCVATLIKQIMPYVEIISIPIFNEQGMTSKKKLCDGLQQALDENVDIVYLGLKVEVCDDGNVQDQEIMRLLSLFSYVVVAAGNDAKSEQKLAFPACAHNIFFSVGAFEKIEEEYIISDFSQFQQNIGPNFVMPGKDLVCYIWSDQAQNFVPCTVSGTSMATALFVGYLAYILMVAKQNFSVQQIQYILKRNVVMLDEKKWAGKVRYGTLDMQKIIGCLEEMHNVQNKISQKNYIKNFEKHVNKIVRQSRLK